MKLFRKIFWMGLGAGLALWAVSRAKAYVRANTPKKAREFVLGSDEENDQTAQKTLHGLADELRTRQQEREAELTERFIRRSEPAD
jgi:exonuclease VII large subunit